MPGECLADTLARAVQVSAGKNFRPALALLLGALDGPLGAADAAHREGAYRQALKWAVKLKNWPVAERLARWLAQHCAASADGWMFLGEALLRLGRHEEAAAALDRAAEIAPDRTDVRILRELLERGDEPLEDAPRVRPFPKLNKAFEQPREAIRRFVLDPKAPERFINKRTEFVTLGSCFAANLSQWLTAAGYRARHERIGEEVNSTYANRYLLDWIEHGAVDSQTEAMDRTFGPEVLQRLRDAFRDVDVFVLTLGVAPCFFDKQTGEFAFFTTKWQTLRERLYTHHVMRTTTVDENFDNVRRILASVRRLARRPPKVILTVSPVPLAGTTEYESAVVADCVSKSTLRLAADRIVREQDGDDIIYWPSFEIVRWCSAYYDHQTPPAFGAQDGKTRHVSPWMVDMIIELFLERYALAGAEPAQTVAAE